MSYTMIVPVRPSGGKGSPHRRGSEKEEKKVGEYGSEKVTQKRDRKEDIKQEKRGKSKNRGRKLWN